jgi:hypothetical protein
MATCYTRDNRGNIPRVRRRRKYGYDNDCDADLETASSAAVDGASLVVTHTGNVDVTTTKGFRVWEDGSYRSITNATASTTDITLTLVPAVSADTTVVVDYDFSGDAVADADGETLVPAYTLTATNNTAA